MKVAKWGNSLAVRLPQEVVERMGLNEGDDIDLFFNENSDLEIARNLRKQAALSAISKFGWKLPEGYKFDREEANSRG